MARSIEQLMQLTQGERLARARKVAGLTQAQMAASVGKDTRTIGRWERDEVHIGRGDLIAWSILTDAPLDWLLTGDARDDTDTAPVTLGKPRPTAWHPSSSQASPPGTPRAA